MAPKPALLSIGVAHQRLLGDNQGGMLKATLNLSNRSGIINAAISD